MTHDAIRRALHASWFVGTVYDSENSLQAMIRVIGDGALTFYIADVMVHPDTRGLGLGDKLMEAALTELRPVAVPGATVAVVPLHGREAFYARLGFVSAPLFGEGMAWAEPLSGLPTT